MENSGCVNPVSPSRSRDTVYVATKYGQLVFFYVASAHTHTHASGKSAPQSSLKCCVSARMETSRRGDAASSATPAFVAR